MITATPYRLMTLSISPVHNDPHKVECNINFAEKKPLNLHEPETYDSSHISGSYWVLGNLKKVSRILKGSVKWSISAHSCPG